MINCFIGECLEDALEDIGDFHHNDDRRLTSDCECKPPCNSDVYDVTFSCSQWPSGASDVILLSTLNL
jgi:hypothetical protein